jgi:hypothetical protein
MFVIDADTSPEDTDPTHRARGVVDRQHRATLAALHAAQHEAEAQLNRADTTATSLLGLFGVALAAALALAHTSGSLPASVLLAAASLPLLGSVAALLLVLRASPRHGNGFTRWALFGEHADALVEELTLPARHSVPLQAARLADLAAAAVTKYQRVNAAVVLLLIGLGLLTLAVLIP